MSTYGIEFEMQHKIIRKFEKIGATSEEKAVTFKEAKLNEQEEVLVGLFCRSFSWQNKKDQKPSILHLENKNNSSKSKRHLPFYSCTSPFFRVKF